MATKPVKTAKSTSTSGKTTTATSGKRVTTSRSVTKKPAASSGGARSVASKSGGSGAGSSGTRAIKKQPAPAAKKKASAPAKLAGAPLASRWIAGPGDERPMCSVIAVANSLLAVLGVTAPNAELERLYRAAGGHGDSGVPVPAVLAAVAEHGIAGCRLASHSPAASTEHASLLLLSLDASPDLHAVAHLGSGTVATWGDAVPLGDLDADVHAAWHLAWHQ